MNVDSQVVIRRLDAMTELLTHLERLGITGSESLADISIRLQIEAYVGLRNILTHEYVDIDLGIVAQAVPRAREFFTDYVRAVARSLPR